MRPPVHCMPAWESHRKGRRNLSRRHLQSYLQCAEVQNVIPHDVTTVYSRNPSRSPSSPRFVFPPENGVQFVDLSLAVPVRRGGSASRALHSSAGAIRTEVGLATIREEPSGPARRTPASPVRLAPHPAGC